MSRDYASKYHEAQARQAEQDKRKNIGFWKQGNRYVSAVILKKDVPGWSRLVVMKNKYKQQENQPDFVAYWEPVKKD